MAMFNYGVGGNEIVVDANDAIQEIQENKTLIAGKLTNDSPANPEIVTGLKTVEDVFKRFKPAISIDHETENGGTVNETFSFNSLGDFTPKNMIQNSSFLKNLSVEQEQYNNIIRQVRGNKVLRNMLADDKAKAAFIETLKMIAEELENNNN
ncbi:MAG: type VI secretion system contractile sheath small subunit [Chitinophagaceae bacterium]|nr:type VI secretion system contractile sheath small subunit [Chitinophagaceae bacterium]